MMISRYLHCYKHKLLDKGCVFPVFFLLFHLKHANIVVSSNSGVRAFFAIFSFFTCAKPLSALFGVWNKKKKKIQNTVRNVIIVIIDITARLALQRHDVLVIFTQLKLQLIVFMMNYLDSRSRLMYMNLNHLSL